MGNPFCVWKEGQSARLAQAPEVQAARCAHPWASFANARHTAEPSVGRAPGNCLHFSGPWPTEESSCLTWA